MTAPRAHLAAASRTARNENRNTNAPAKTSQYRPRTHHPPPVKPGGVRKRPANLLPRGASKATAFHEAEFTAP
jgi:hypothetical protein